MVPNVTSGVQAWALLPVVNKVLRLSVRQIDGNGGRPTPSLHERDQHVQPVHGELGHQSRLPGRVGGAVGQEVKVGAENSLACSPKSFAWVWHCDDHIVVLVLRFFFFVLPLAVIELLSQEVAIKLHECEMNVPKEADMLVLRINLLGRVEMDDIDCVSCKFAIAQLVGEGIIRELDIPLAGQPVQQSWVSVHNRIEDVLVGEAGREHRHQVRLGNQPPDLRPIRSPQDSELHENDTCVEAPPQGRPGPMVFPQLAWDVPVALVFHQTKSLSSTKPLENSPQPADVGGKSDIGVQDNHTSQVMG